MKAMRVLTLLTVIVGALTFAVAAPADYGRTLTGELVAMSGNQFRIVGHGGPFTAPAGTSVSALDGHTVQVEVSSTGKVTQVTEVTVPINPVVHGWSTVRGQVMVTDPASRRFTFAGDTQAYVAPPSIDIAAYNGKLVEIKMDESGQVTDVHLVAGEPQTWNSAPAVIGCSYGGEAYSAGAAVCQSGMQYRCDGSQWRSAGIACQAVASSYPVAPVAVHPAPVPVPAAPRSCVVGDATVANGSSICRSGSTYRCDDGTWLSMQTACR